MIILESIILAAGYCSRFNFKNSSYKKYMLPLEKSNILNYLIVAMDKAKINKINIIVDESVDTSTITKSFNKFVKNINIKPPKINFIENFYPERENGYSLYIGVREVLSNSFILSMADHVFSENIYLHLVNNYNDEDIILATDPMKIDGIYDLDDCTKVYGSNLNIKMIGKKISQYNRLDMGVFMMKTETIRKISNKIEKEKQNFGVSDVVLSAISSNLKVTYLDLPNTIWLDVDDHIEYEKLKKIFNKSSKFRPFDLDFKFAKF